MIKKKENVWMVIFIIGLEMTKANQKDKRASTLETIDAWKGIQHLMLVLEEKQQQWETKGGQSKNENFSIKNSGGWQKHDKENWSIRLVHIR